MKPTTTLATATLGLAILLGAGPAAAQAYPVRPVTVVIASGQGGVMNTVARILFDDLEKTWKQPVVLENRPGAAGHIGADYVRRATPDGHTLCFCSDAVTSFGVFAKGITFDPTADLVPLTMATAQEFLMMTNAKHPARSMAEFISVAKANPGKFNFGTLGRAQVLLEILRFNRAVGIELESVLYQTPTSAMTDLIANNFQFYVAGSTSVKGHIDAGTIVPLAVTSEKRAANLPNVPTLKELGFDITARFWLGFFAPPGTPAPLADRIAADLRGALMKPGVHGGISRLGATVVASTPAEFRTAILADMKLRQQVAREANIRPE